jgi:hypothetical protein
VPSSRLRRFGPEKQQKLIAAPPAMSCRGQYCQKCEPSPMVTVLAENRAVFVPEQRQGTESSKGETVRRCSGAGHAANVSRAWQLLQAESTV